MCWCVRLYDILTKMLYHNEPLCVMGVSERLAVLKLPA